MNSDQGLIAALEPVARTFHSMGIQFYVGGSVASSFHGAARSTMDIDLVADLSFADVDPFVSILVHDGYYVSQTAIKDAITRT